MKVLVTGGTGFIGSHLVEKLCMRGNQVTSIAKDGLNAEILKRQGASVILGDLNNSISWDGILDGIDVVYHLAGLTRSRFAREYYEANTDATRRLVNICSTLAPNLKRFLYVSSLTAVGPSPDGRPLGEDAPCRPVSHYGKSKMLAELEVLRASDRLPVTIVRPAAVYGPRDREWCEYVRLTVRGIQPRVGFGKKLMSIIHADDLTEGILRAAETPQAAGRVYFLAGERPCTMLEFGHAIAAALNKHPLRLPLPHAVAYVVGGVEEALGKIFGHDVMFNIQKVKEAVQYAWTCSIERAQAELGFCPRIPLVEGMRATCTWYRNNHWI